MINRDMPKPTKTLPYLLGSLVADAIEPIFAHVIAVARKTLLLHTSGHRRALLLAAWGPSSTPKTWTLN